MGLLPLGRSSAGRFAAAGLGALLLTSVGFTSPAAGAPPHVAGPLAAISSGSGTPPAPRSTGSLPTSSADPGREAEFLVKYRSADADPAAEFLSAPARSRRKALDLRAGAVAVGEIPASSIEVVRLREGVAITPALKELRSDPAVELVEPNATYTALAGPRQPAPPNDTYFADQWSLDNTGQNGGWADADIDAPEAWRLATPRVAPVIVVVIDSGVDYTHPDLAGSMWTNPGEIPNDGIDNDRNGYTDDVHGWDAVDSDGDPADPHGHGTHVAGVIGATRNNGAGVAGVATNIKIAACRFLNAGGSGTTTGAITCLDYVRALRTAGHRVIATNNSWSGGSRSELLRRAIDAQRDVLFIAAAGNDSNDLDAVPEYPASYGLPSEIVVAATDRTDHRPTWSNYGRATVSLSAPGADILSLRARGTDIYGDGSHLVPAGDPDAQYYLASGTSMAAPHVAGVAALIKSRTPGLDWRAVKNLLLAGGDPVASLETTTVTGRRLNANTALTCTNRPVFAVAGTPPTFPLAAGSRVTFTVLSISCAHPVGGVQATTSAGARFKLLDDGVAPDLAAGDGLFTATFTPTASTDSITFSAGTRSESLPYLALGRYLPEARVDAAYRFPLRTFFGVAPYRWAITEGTLPEGLSLSADGVVSGTATTVGHARFSLRVVDAKGRVAVGAATLEVTNDDVTENLLTIDNGTVPLVPQGNALDGEGNTVVVGYWADPVTRTEDIVVKKYGPDGALLWSRFRSGTSAGPSRAQAVATDVEGNIYVTAGDPRPRVDSDVIVVKYDPMGNEVWTTRYSDGASEFPRGITVDGAGSVIVTGNSTPFGGRSRALTVKVDTDGQVAWARAFTQRELEVAGDVDTDAAGNIYVGGGSAYAYSVDDGITFSYSYLVLKYDTDGALVWSQLREMPGYSLEAATAIAVDDAGNSYVGDAMSTAIEKYDTDGTLMGRWQPSERQGGTADLALDSYGNLVIAEAFYDVEIGRWSNGLIAVDTARGELLWNRRVGGDYGVGAMDVSVDGSDVAHVTLPSAGGVVLTTYVIPPFVAALEITRSGALAAGYKGQEYFDQLTSFGGSAPVTWSVTAGSLPPGITLDADTGVLSGVPTTGGTFTFTVTATDASGQTVSAEVWLEIPHMLLNWLMPGGLTIGQSVSVDVTAEGGTAPLTWKLAAGDLPPGLAFGQEGEIGRISGTPTTLGTWSFTVLVVDAEGHEASVDVTLYVVEPLEILTTGLPDAAVSVPYDVTLQARGGAEPYYWYLQSASNGFTLSTDGHLSGVPADPGTYEFVVGLVDQSNTSRSTVLTLTVT